LQLSGVAVTLNQSIAAASLGNLTYTAAAGASVANNYATIGFKVQDNGGTANSGVDTSVAANTLTVSLPGWVEYSIDSGAWVGTYTPPTTQGNHTVQMRQTDYAGNVTLSNVLSFTLDTVAPTLQGVAGNLSGAMMSGYGQNVTAQVGTPLYVTLDFSEAVTIEANVGVRLDMGGNTVVATYESASSTTRKFFKYTVVKGDIDMDAAGVTIMPGTNSIVNASGIKDLAGNVAVVNIVNPTTQYIYKSNPTPLVLDLNGDGVRTTSVAKGVWFDVAANGQPALTGWADSTDGLLVLDLNGDGQINNGTELFGNGTDTANGKARDGYAALAQHDLNSDAVIDSQDAVFANLQVWVDGNVDGLTQAGELHSLASLGIVSMGLQAQIGTQVDNGNTLGLTSNWTGADGQQHAMADVFFASTSLQDLVQQATAKLDLDADPAANVQNVHLADVLATDQKLMVIKTGSNDVVNLDLSGWSNSGTTTAADSHTYALWNNGAAHLLIDQNAQVHQVL